MTSYEHSAADLLPLPERALTALSDRLGSFVLVGSWARDVCLQRAGLRLGRATDDLDIAVATPSLAELDARLGDLGPRRGHGVRIRCDGIDVDVLPFGGLARHGVVEPALDSSLDVTGLAEAHDHADVITLSSGLRIRTASLPLMLALKVVAWDVRSPGTDKDAEDLSRLIEATYHGPHLVDCYTAPSAPGWEFDVELIGPHSAGVALGQVLHASSRHRIASILTGPRADRLAAAMPGRGRSHPDQLRALARGIGG